MGWVVGSLDINIVLVGDGGRRLHHGGVRGMLNGMEWLDGGGEEGREGEINLKNENK